MSTLKKMVTFKNTKFIDYAKISFLLATFAFLIFGNAQFGFEGNTSIAVLKGEDTQKFLELEVWIIVIFQTLIWIWWCRRSFCVCLYLYGDGDEDMILEEYSGYCYYLENMGRAGNPAIFNTSTTLMNSDSEVIFDRTYTCPRLVDLDRDGDQDLVIGKRTGKIQYFENIGVGSIVSNLSQVF